MAERVSRLTYLMFQVMAKTMCSWAMAMEAVTSTAIEHPEWDLSELKTWDEWEKDTTE